MSASTMPVNTDNLPVTDTPEARRTRGIELTRPFPRVVKASHCLGWLLIFVGLAEVIVGSIIFKDWRIVGGFWVGFMGWAAGVAGTCVSISENSGGFPTAVFFFQSSLSLVAATLSLILIEGPAYTNVRDTEGNCFDTSSCLGGACGSYDCVCWKPDGSEDCDEGTSKRICVTFLGDEDCDKIGDPITSTGLGNSLAHFVSPPYNYHCPGSCVDLRFVRYLLLL